MVARPWSSRSDGLPDAAHAVLFLGKPFLGNTNQGSPRFMGNRHDDQDATGTGHDPAADLLRDALECEVEGAWMQRRLEDGTCDESLGAEMRAQALVAFDAAAADDLLEEALGLDAAEEATAALRSGARVAALEAWDRASSGLEAAPAPLLSLTAARAERERREPLRARRMRAPFFMRPVAAAAMLLVALGAGLFLFGQGDDAEAGLQLRALSRRDLSSNVGMSQVRPGYFATLGRVFAPREDELLSFGLAHDGLVVVGAGDAVRVTRPTARVPGTAPTVLRLESGEARLATTRDAPVPLEVDGVGLLVLTEGAAHVALHAETADGAPAVALAEHSVARFHRADGTSVPLAGPTRVLLAADGVRSFGTPARSLFRELAFFGGPLPPVTQVRTVSARLFDVREGDVRRGRQDLRLLAAADGKDTAARLAWRPPLALADARVLRVALRAPVGTTVALAQRDGAEPRATVERAGGTSEPGVAVVELPLEGGWFERLPEGRLELSLTVPAGADEPTTTTTTRRRKSVRAWFDGISLVLGGVSTPQAKSVPGAPAGG